MDRFKIDGLKENLREDLENRVVEHRNRFINLFLSRYKEMLPYLITYDNIEFTSINPLQLEHSLRNNINVVVGQAKNGKIMILGYVTKEKQFESASDFLQNGIILKDDINFTIPKHLIPDTMKEITNYDDCQSGNFIVMRNKALSYVNDYEILKHYTNELGEIALSRYSLTLQAKINTFFIGNNNDETINQIVKKLYNGSPYVSVTKYFDPKDHIYTIENTGLAYMFTELKREYQNKITELNNMLGINSLAVDKESGVSDTEAKSNKGFTTSNANIYISTRQNEINKLNKRFNLDILVKYNDEVKSQLLQLGEEMEEEND